MSEVLNWFDLSPSALTSGAGSKPGSVYASAVQAYSTMSESVKVNVVVTGQLTVSAMGRSWLVKNGVLPEEQDPDDFYSPVAAQHITPSFELLMVGSRMQLAGKELPLADAVDAITRAADIILAKAPSAALLLSGIGVNFNYLLEGADVTAAGHALVSPDARFLTHFPGEQSRFGISACTAVGGAMATMEVDPLSAGEYPGHAYRAGFNFHLSTESADEARAMLAKIGQYMQFAEACVASVKKDLAPHGERVE